MKKIILFTVLLCCASVVVAKNSSVLGFIENKGQIIDQYYHLNEQVKFMGVHNGFKVQLKANSFSYEVLKTKKFQFLNPKFKNQKHTNTKPQIDDSTVIFSHRIDVELINANPKPQIIKEGKSNDYLNYYTTATPENGVTKVYYFSKVKYQNIYPNIDLEFVTDASLKQPFKYNFIVRPGGKVSDIQLQYNGAKNISLVQNGGLNIATAYGYMEESIPSSYVAETGKDIAVHYQQNREGVYGFSARNYNAQQTLVIDPWATYYGGDGTEGNSGVSCDLFGNINVTGGTNSTSNIATTGAYQNVLSGNDDVYIAKFDVVGSRIWATYYGGAGDEGGYGVVCDNNNNVIIVGETTSINNIASIGAYQSTYAGNEDVFIAKFNPNGFRIWGTYYGGTGADHGVGITSDNINNIIIIGNTGSSGLASVGAHQTVNDSGDALIVKFDSNGNRLWATYYGGSNQSVSFLFEEANCIATDNNENILVAGFTNSLNNISTIGCQQEIFCGGLYDGFVVKFNSAGVRQWGTYYGGSHEDEIRGVAVDASDNIVIGGFTGSPNNIATPGSFKSTNSTANAFLAKFTSTGTRIWGTYYGGSGNGDYGNAVAIGDSNNIVLAGYASSLDSIATLGSYKDTLTLGSASLDFDAFLVKFDSSGNRMWGTYFGGEGDEDAINGVDVAYNGNIVVTGSTNSPSGIATPNAFQTAIDSVNMYDAFIASFSSSGQLATAISGLSNPAKNNLLQVYPNPAKEKITVSVKEFGGKAGSISLLSLEGKLLKQQSVKTETTHMDMSGLPSGVYLLQYDDGEVCKTVKFVKE